MDRCKAKGYDAVVVLGYPDYYPRFGFAPAISLRISCEYDVPDEAFMFIELEPGALNCVTGTVAYNKAFRSA